MSDSNQTLEQINCKIDIKDSEKNHYVRNAVLLPEVIKSKELRLYD